MCISTTGTVLAKHRKVHLFDIDIPGKIRFKESETLSAGDAITVFDVPWKGEKTSVRCALAICYDIRFPELHLAAREKGAEILLIPAAFNMTTGPKHWELVARARAIDTQCYVLMCSAARNVQASYHAWGHSMVVSPWGAVLAEVGNNRHAREWCMWGVLAAVCYFRSW